MKDYKGRLNVEKFCPHHTGQPVSAWINASNPEAFCAHCISGFEMVSSKPSLLPTDFELSDADYQNKLLD